jgi:hypothetical protein
MNNDIFKDPVVQSFMVGAATGSRRTGEGWFITRGIVDPLLNQNIKRGMTYHEADERMAKLMVISVVLGVVLSLAVPLVVSWL